MTRCALERGQVRKDLAESQEEVESLCQLLKTAMTGKATLEERVEQLLTDLDEGRETIEHLNAVMSQVEHEREAERSGGAALSRDLAALKAEQEASLRDRREQAACYERELDAARGAAAAAAVEAERAREEVERIQARAVQSDRDMDELRRELLALRTQEAETSEAKRQAVAEADAARGRCAMPPVRQAAAAPPCCLRRSRLRRGARPVRRASRGRELRVEGRGRVSHAHASSSRAWLANWVRWQGPAAWRSVAGSSGIPEHVGVCVRGR